MIALISYLMSFTVLETSWQQIIRCYRDLCFHNWVQINPALERRPVLALVCCWTGYIGCLLCTMYLMLNYIICILYMDIHTHIHTHKHRCVYTHPFKLLKNISGSHMMWGFLQTAWCIVFYAILDEKWKILLELFVCSVTCF